MKKNTKKLIALLAVLCMVIAQFGTVVAEEPVAECPDSPTGKHIIDHYIDNPGGTEGVDKTVYATCTTPGTQVGVCQYCGQIPENAPFIAVKALGHDYVLTEDYEHAEGDKQSGWNPEPTCCTGGTYETVQRWICTRCGQVDPDRPDDVITYEEVGPTGEHNFGGDPQPIGVVPEATCVEGGTYETAVFCQNPGCTAYDPESVKEVEVKPLGHNTDEEGNPIDVQPVLENVVQSTCTQPGSADEVVYCQRCHIELSRKHIALPLAEHTWPDDPEPVLIQAATCMDYAKYDLVYKCTVCGVELDREYNCDDADLVGTAHGTYYYHTGTKREGLLDHDFSDLDEDNPNYVAPTCYSEGTGVYFCSICGQKNETREIPRLDHNYGDEYTVPATCMTKGAIMKECQNEGCYDAYVADPEDNATHYLVVEELKIDPDAHKWVLAPENPGADQSAEGHDTEEGSATRLPTCTKQGVNAWVCEYNNAHRYAEQVPALDHIYFTLPAIPAQCKDYEDEIGGWTSGMLCIRLDDQGESICDAESAGDIPEDYLAALQEADEATYNAIEALDDYNVLAVPVETDPVPHTRLVIKTPDSATCTEPGQITYYCAVCGKEVTEDTPANNHKWFRVEEDDENATCINGGYASFRCENCGEEKREYIPATGEHDFGEWITKPATCKEAGRIYRVCATCLYEDVQKFLDIDPEAHVWEIDQSQIKKEPTCTDAGIGGQKCTVCGATKYGKIDPLGHDPLAIGGQEATCTEPGFTASVVCARCLEVLEEPEFIDALGHDWEEVEVEGATCVKPGKATNVCTRCGEIEEVPGVYGDHTLIRWEALDKAPTCVTPGAEAYVCYYCDYVEYRANGKADPAAHVWVKLEQISVPTCVSGALDLYACYFCDARVIKESETSKADPSNHVWCDVGDMMACYYCDATKAK